MEEAQRMAKSVIEPVIKKEMCEDAERNANESMKCGEVFLLQSDEMILICCFCNDSFAGMIDFGTHVQNEHVKPKEIFECAEIETLKRSDSEDEFPQQEEDNIDTISKNPLNDSQLDVQERRKLAKREKTKQWLKARGSYSKEIKDPSLYCTHCSWQYEMKSRYDTHMEIKHQIPRPCEFCDKTSRTIEERIEHEKTHGGVYPCMQCSKIFKQKNHRDTHVQIVHEGIKPFKCHECDRSFATKTLLRGHGSVHSWASEFSCDYCDRKFAHLSRKKMHMLSHTGEKKYQCDECGNRYSTQSFLTCHKKQHTGIKDVPCDICGMMFYSTRHRNSHRRTHKQVRKHGCSVCGKLFKRGCALKQHMKLHSDVKEYSCSICGKEFAQLAGLHSHKKAHLNESLD